MIDVLTNRLLRVRTEGTAGPNIRLAYSQVPEVQQLLERHDIRHWVDETIISLNGGPYVARIHLGRGGDARAVQALLDSVP